MFGDLYEKLLNSAFRFVSFRPRSVKETTDFLQKKLNKWKVRDQAILDKVIQRLGELDYLDDRKFATWWVNQRQTFRPKGRQTIKAELLMKGINRELIEGLDPGLSEVETATKAIQKKIILWQKLPLLNRKKKLFDYLARRGFASDSIWRVIDEVTKKE